MNGPQRKRIRATVSGSFHRHMSAIYDAVGALTEVGVEVLSPADPRIVDQLGDFLFVASDRMRSVRLVEDRHLECIRASSLLWLVTPDGYVGQSASLELGFAAAVGTPVFASHEPTDVTLQNYVSVVPTMSAAIENVMAAGERRARADSVLIEPLTGITRAHDYLDEVQSLFELGPPSFDDAIASTILARLHKLSAILSSIELQGSTTNQNRVYERTGQLRAVS